MLKSNTVTSSLWLANYLAQKNITLHATPNTILSELVQLSKQAESSASFHSGEKSYSIYGLMNDGNFADTISYMTSVKPVFLSEELENPHTEAINKYVKDISRFVTDHISVAKNVVNPKVTALTESISSFINSYREMDYRKDFEIKVEYVPEFLLNEVFGDTLENYSSGKINEPTNTLKLPNMSFDEIISLMELSSDFADNDLKIWISKLNPDVIRNIWIEYFSDIVHKKYFVNPLITDNPFTALNTALVVFILANNLSNKVSEETSLSLKEYQIVCDVLKNYAGGIIYINLVKIKNYINSNILIVEKSSSDKTVSVNGVIYDKWLENNNTPEVILGALVDDFQLNGYDILYSKKDYLYQKWMEYVAFKDSDQNSVILRELKEKLKSDFAKSIAEENLTSFEKDYILHNPGYKISATKIAEDYIDSLKYSDIEDANNVSLNIVAKGKYFYTSSYDILSDMKETMKTNSKLTAREAGLIATINYILVYLLHQTTEKNRLAT